MSITSGDIALVVPVYASAKEDLNKFLEQHAKYCRGCKIYFAYEDQSCIFNFEEHVQIFARENELEYDVRKFYGQRGIGFALSQTVRHVNQQYVMRHDIGDDILEDRVNEAVNSIRKNPDVDIFYTDAIIVKNNIEKIFKAPRTEDELKNAFMYKNPICHPTVIFKKNSILLVGNYDFSLRYCEDLDLWLRAIKRKLKFFCITIPTVRYFAPGEVRTNKHWRSNLLSRIKNFGSPSILKSLLSIVIVTFFYTLPTSLKRKIYDKVN